ncbi:putative glycerol-1-phosphate prenyltransferase [Pullulanibacillus pueri]|uniref:Heptaprenylglyceryl phosphate synthase n=1 Tax=Pullulanibacillus pueri TaxID=1437324 RepID=A0A8J3EMF3_9BACL|nr:heptaprenylglyceryl phosphate synthase [Pullulanibacillus pueri]MBM7682745.1 putative glycerol-1-phosphate prenyltransferase [Pullulanibacillus pueri]GGH83023.1 heptaprenylglyceryl phosphate synthase [Pullulanibacillus pueri]
MNEYKDWRHVFKLDPNKPIDDKAIEQICESGTDAVIVGGTDGVTLDNTLHLLSRIRQYAVDCALEISNIDAVTPGFDYYMIPTVLNSSHPDWIVGFHHEAIKAFGKTLHWDEVIMEGYCILNPDAKAAQLTAATTDLETEDIVAYAMMAERMFHLPVFYLEYSGTYGDVDVVREVRQTLQETQLFYGGGIDTVVKAKEMAAHADTVIVGNVIYEDIKTALKTVKAVKEIQVNK